MRMVSQAFIEIVTCANSDPTVNLYPTQRGAVVYDVLNGRMSAIYFDGSAEHHFDPSRN